MKSVLTLLLCLAFLPAFTQGPTGGPDGFGYTYRNQIAPNGPTYQWYDITTIGTQVTGLADDNFVGPFPLSGFTYYTGTPTQFWIGSNGYISFSPVNIASSGAMFPAIPTAGGPNNFIAGLLTDLNFSGAGNPATCYRHDNGDSVVVTFKDVPFWINNAVSYGGSNTFQIILNKLDTSITVNYQSQSGLPDPTYTTNFLTMGIEDATGATGLQYYRGTLFPTANTSIKYYYPASAQPIVDAGILWNDNPDNGGKFILRLDTFRPVTHVKNVGNQRITNLTLDYDIFDNNQISLSNGTFSMTNLVAGADTTVQFSNNFTPFFAGTYDFQSVLSGVPLDQFSSNDSMSHELVVVDSSGGFSRLDYSDGLSNGGIGWTGGNGGVAIYVEPPYYPCRITDAGFFISANTIPAVGFYTNLYDDNGPNGGPGTQLDSVFVPGVNVITAQYNTVSYTKTPVIDSGGVYVLWHMGGDGINIGQDNNPPISQRTYEILFGVWSDYRDKATQDFLMYIDVEPAIITGISERFDENDISIYPQPAQEFVPIEGKALNRMGLQYRLLDTQGKIVPSKVLQYPEKLQLMRSGTPSGLYVFQILEGDEVRYQGKVIFSD